MSIKNNIIARIEIPNYTEHIQLSKSRRAVYYKKGDKIPKKYLKNPIYKFNSLNILINSKTNEKVIKNSRTVGKERLKKISGQELWSGMYPVIRSNIARHLKEYFREHFKKNNLQPLTEDQYPIGVKIDFHKSIGEGNWDLDNHAIFYRKTIMDSLKGIITDDSVRYVRSIPCNYYDCLDKDKKLVITIFKLNANN